MKPLLNICKAFCICYIIDDNDALRVAVVASGDRAEPFLSRSIPLQQMHSKQTHNAQALAGASTYDLQLRGLAVAQLHGLDLEVHAYGAHVALGVGVVGEPEHQAALAHARVADEEQLEQVVVFRS